MNQPQGNLGFSLAVSWRRALMQDCVTGHNSNSKKYKSHRRVVLEGFYPKYFSTKLLIFRSYHSEKIMSRLSVICRCGTETCFTFSFLKGSFKNNDMFDVVIYLTNWRWFSHVSLPELIN